MSLPILYSFRRCPYAMRARLALAISGAEIRIREVVLRDKPAEMLAASPKGTVPVLVLPDGQVVDESLDVMKWALARSDPENWRGADSAETDALIVQSDGAFKHALDRYKYPNRYDGVDPEAQRTDGLAILAEWNARIVASGGQLLGPDRTLADMALFPFVRQFAATDREWFAAQSLPALQEWLAGHLASPLFKSIMTKHAQWRPDSGGRIPAG
ncbi:MAG: glutathione S-transferase [Alphaproteobacteria bacterium]|nr:glutathione S-transferase [Alphaproteobacteria bacterium]MBU2083988.1 glutathione S-transferase [Alphaproteobacteria bacterium]MBU2196265.1 glutathione S-transferase [Alphaproteobacteria bacterium]